MGFYLYYLPPASPEVWFLTRRRYSDGGRLTRPASPLSALSRAEATRELLRLTRKRLPLATPRIASERSESIHSVSRGPGRSCGRKKNVNKGWGGGGSPQSHLFLKACVAMNKRRAGKRQGSSQGLVFQWWEKSERRDAASLEA